MGYYDTQQICLNGHQITDHFHRFPARRKKYCPQCGAETIYQCPHCQTPIKGYYTIDGGGSIPSTIPICCDQCGQPLPWADQIKNAQKHAAQKNVAPDSPFQEIEQLCRRFPLVAHELQRPRTSKPTLPIEDEYDAHYLFRGLLYLFFDDIRPEIWTPNYAGKASRMDFLVKKASLAVEVKMTREGLSEKELGDQLIIDINRYQISSECKYLACLVYDPDHRINNPRGFESDLSKPHNHLHVKIFVVT